jgi:hypothetical protein
MQAFFFSEFNDMPAWLQLLDISDGSGGTANGTPCQRLEIATTGTLLPQARSGCSFDGGGLRSIAARTSIARPEAV